MTSNPGLSTMDIEIRELLKSDKVPEAVRNAVLRDQIARLHAMMPPGRRDEAPGAPYEIPVVRAGSMDGMRRTASYD